MPSKAQLPKGEYNLAVRRQVQNRHILGTKEYEQYAEKLALLGLKPSIIPHKTCLMEGFT